MSGRFCGLRECYQAPETLIGVKIYQENIKLNSPITSSLQNKQLSKVIRKGESRLGV